MRQYHPLFVFLNPLIEGQKCFCVYVWLIRAVCNQEGVIVTLVRLFLHSTTSKKNYCQKHYSDCIKKRYSDPKMMILFFNSPVLHQTKYKGSREEYVFVPSLLWDKIKPKSLHKLWTSCIILERDFYQRYLQVPYYWNGVLAPFAKKSHSSSF